MRNHCLYFFLLIAFASFRAILKKKCTRPFLEFVYRFFFKSSEEVFLFIQLQAKFHLEVWKWAGFWGLAYRTLLPELTVPPPQWSSSWVGVSFRLLPRVVVWRRPRGTLQSLPRGKSVHHGHCRPVIAPLPFQSGWWTISFINCEHLFCMYAEVCGYRDVRE